MKYNSLNRFSSHTNPIRNFTQPHRILAINWNCEAKFFNIDGGPHSSCQHVCKAVHSSSYQLECKFDTATQDIGSKLVRETMFLNAIGGPQSPCQYVLLSTWVELCKAHVCITTFIQLPKPWRLEVKIQMDMFCVCTSITLASWRKLSEAEKRYRQKSHL